MQEIQGCDGQNARGASASRIPGVLSPEAPRLPLHRASELFELDIVTPAQRGVADVVVHSYAEGQP